MDDESGLDELYEAPPSEFIARRTALAEELKRRGSTDQLAAVRALRKPTVAAWAVNLLALQRPHRIAVLTQLGEDLRRAQSSLQVADLRALARQRTRLVRELTADAGELAARTGHPLNATQSDQVAGTLVASLSSEQAGEAVASGRLEASLTYAGLGEVDASPAVAAGAVPPATPRGGAAVRQAPSGRAAELERLQELLSHREQAEREAAAEAATARAHRDTLREAVAVAREQLDRAMSDLRAADGAVAQADARREEAQRATHQARAGLRAAGGGLGAARR